MKMLFKVNKSVNYIQPSENDKAMVGDDPYPALPEYDKFAGEKIKALARSDQNFTRSLYDCGNIDLLPIKLFRFYLNDGVTTVPITHYVCVDCKDLVTVSNGRHICSNMLNDPDDELPHLECIVCEADVTIYPHHKCKFHSNL